MLCIYLPVVFDCNYETSREQMTDKLLYFKQLISLHDNNSTSSIKHGDGMEFRFRHPFRKIRVINTS